MTAKKKVGGLAGVSAGETALCTVGKEGAGLTYRGYDIYDLSNNASFEEVAYLLLYGKLPNRAELDAYIARLKTMRGLPDALKVVLEMVPANAHPMDVLRTAVSFLGNIEVEGDFSNQAEVADRLLASLMTVTFLIEMPLSPTDCTPRRYSVTKPLEAKLKQYVDWFRRITCSPTAKLSSPPTGHRGAGGGGGPIGSSTAPPSSPLLHAVRNARDSTRRE